MPMVKCEYCGKELKDRSGLYGHKKIKHKEELLRDGLLVPKGDGEKKTVGIPITLETTEASILRLTPKVQNIPLTPDIFIGYMCAISRGFSGSMTDWLSLTSRDFWFGRGINPYEVISSFGTDGNKDKEENGNTERLGVA